MTNLLNHFPYNIGVRGEEQRRKFKKKTQNKLKQTNIINLLLSHDFILFASQLGSGWKKVHNFINFQIVAILRSNSVCIF
jgi:hypothetical protein